MRLLDLAAAEGFDICPPISYGSLARAILANLKAGLSHGHVIDAAARAYLVDVLAKTEDVLSRGRLHVDTVYSVMIKVLEDYQGRFFFGRTPQPQDYMDHPALSYQPHIGFRYWLNATAVPAVAAVEDPYPATILSLCSAFRNPANREAGGAIGQDVLWLTPFCGEVRVHVDRVREPTLAAGLPEVANRLREMLGLVRRHPGEHAIAFITREPLGNLLDRRGTGPFAPTIFEARGYERFRHWPAAGTQDPSHVGRTYDLNPGARRSAQAGSHGVPEVVTTPLGLEEVESIVYFGVISAADDIERVEPGIWVARDSDDQEFAEEVSAGEDAIGLAAWLSERLGI